MISPVLSTFWTACALANPPLHPEFLQWVPRSRVLNPATAGRPGIQIPCHPTPVPLCFVEAGSGSWGPDVSVSLLIFPDWSLLGPSSPRGKLPELSKPDHLSFSQGPPPYLSSLCCLLSPFSSCVHSRMEEHSLTGVLQPEWQPPNLSAFFFPSYFSYVSTHLISNILIKFMIFF